MKILRDELRLPQEAERDLKIRSSVEHGASHEKGSEMKINQSITVLKNPKGPSEEPVFYLNKEVIDESETVIVTQCRELILVHNSAECHTQVPVECSFDELREEVTKIFPSLKSISINSVGNDGVYFPITNTPSLRLVESFADSPIHNKDSGTEKYDSFGTLRLHIGELRAEDQTQVLDEGDDKQLVHENQTLKLRDSVNSRLQSSLPPELPELLLLSEALPMLYVGNLDYQIEDSDLEVFFKDCGELTFMRSSKEDDQKFKGSYLVRFSSQKATDNALQLSGSKLKDRPIYIVPTEYPGDMGGKNAICNAYSEDKQVKYAIWVSYVNKISITGIATSEDLKDILIEHFAACGEILEINFSFKIDNFEKYAEKGTVEIVFSDEEAIRRACARATSYCGVRFTVEPLEHNVQEDIGYAPNGQL